ncbi:MAG: MBL fold metallo-hydrolase [Symploca sp. SIO3C6]|nr:MBL fold metallo-hydrolase [Symploca sp. SIO3C6]
MSNQRLMASTRDDERLLCLPYGAGHDSEGVCLLVQMGPHRILLDCGLADISPLQTEAKPPADWVICSHAHSDHARGLLALHKAFPHLPVYASEVTTQLLPLNWSFSSPEDIPKFCHALPWRSPIEFCDGCSVELFPAGHLPGAAAILLTYASVDRTYRLLYTGDCFRSNLRLVEGLSIESLRGIPLDVLIVEGSYGTARHPHRRQQEKQLMARIEQVIADQHSVVMPLPTLGLGQEILMLLRSHHLFTGRNLDIWVEGSVAAGCDAYLEVLPHLPASVQNFARHQPLFWDERVRPRVRRLDQEQLHTLGHSPCIILCDTTTDLSKYWHAEAAPPLILLPETAREYLNADDSLTTDVETYLLAEHSDCLGTTQLIHNLRPQHVVFVHGSPTYLADLTGLEELQNRYHLHCPAAGTLVELTIGETFIQPAPPAETNYEGELTELDTFVNITLPEAIAADPRWQNFADTGLVEARWQGEELVLRGLSQREILTHSNNAKVPSNSECCGNCLHQRGQRCWNRASPLYGFKVTPVGYCLVFEPIPPLPAK